MGGIFCGALSYADDIILLSPSYQGMQNMLDISNVFAKEQFIQFNAKKSHTLIFKSNCYKYISCAPLYLKGQSIQYSCKKKHLGHMLNINVHNSVDIECVASDFIKSVNRPWFCQLVC